MQAQPTEDVTALLWAWTGADEMALDRLLPVLCDSHLTVCAYLRLERSSHTIQTAVPINAVFLRLVDIHHNRVHFLPPTAQL